MALQFNTHISIIVNHKMHGLNEFMIELLFFRAYLFSMGVSFSIYKLNYTKKWCKLNEHTMNYLFYAG